MHGTNHKIHKLLQYLQIYDSTETSHKKMTCTNLMWNLMCLTSWYNIQATDSSKTLVTNYTVLQSEDT